MVICLRPLMQDSCEMAQCKSYDRLRIDVTLELLDRICPPSPGSFGCRNNQ